MPQARWDRRLHFIRQVLAAILEVCVLVVEAAQLDLEQPPEVEQPQVAGGQLAMGLKQRVEQPVALDQS